MTPDHFQGAVFAPRPPTGVIARRRSRRGNPFFWQLVLVGTACTGNGLPRPVGPCNDRCNRWSAPGLRFPLSLRGAKRRGNPFFWQLVHIGTSCTGYGLPRPLWGLAMTAVVDGLRLGFIFPCHCEERSDVAISGKYRSPEISRPSVPGDCHGPFGASQ